MDLEKDLLKVISEVNRTLSQYEKDWVSCERVPGSRERCESFEHFIELRFNRECYKIPEFQKLILATEGHLFKCTEVENQDLEKRKYSIAHVEMLDPELIRDEDTDIKEMLNEMLKLFGGRKISFNGVKKKIKYKIEN